VNTKSAQQDNNLYVIKTKKKNIIFLGCIFLMSRCPDERDTSKLELGNRQQIREKQTYIQARFIRSCLAFFFILRER